MATTAIVATVTTIVCGFETIAILNTFCRGAVLKSLSYTMSGALKTITYLTEYDQPTVKEVMSELKNIDLDNKIRLTQKLLSELELLGDQYESETIDHAIIALKEQIDLINIDLNNMKDAVDGHAKKYFANWRHLSCGNMINSVVKKKIVLDTRYKDLVTLLKIRKLLSAKKVPRLMPKVTQPMLTIRDKDIVEDVDINKTLHTTSPQQITDTAKVIVNKVVPEPTSNPIKQCAQYINFGSNIWNTSKTS